MDIEDYLDCFQDKYQEFVKKNYYLTDKRARISWPISVLSNYSIIQDKKRLQIVYLIDTDLKFIVSEKTGVFSEYMMEN